MRLETLLESCFQQTYMSLVTLLVILLADIGEFCNTVRVMLLADIGESCSTVRVICFQQTYMSLVTLLESCF